MNSTINLYLKTMYLLEINLGKIRVTDVALKLGFTKSSVSKILNKLKNEGYIIYESYGSICLTDKAINLAKEVLYKEDILELFLVGVLDVPLEKVKNDIDVISNHLSIETRDNLKEYLRKSLRIDDKACGTSKSCKICEIKKLKNKVTANKKWKNILEEDKNVVRT